MAFLKRKNYIINREFQFKFILYSFIPSLFCIFIFYSSINIYFQKVIEDGYAMGYAADHPYFSTIADQKILMNYMFTTCSVFIFIFYIIWGIFISHRIAGPLYRLTKFFKESKDGAFEVKLSFRPGDFFLEIPEAINEWIDKGSHLKKSDPTPLVDAGSATESEKNEVIS